MSTILKKQFLFSRMLSHLLNFAFKQGYEVTIGECYRPDETAALYAKIGKGIKNSVHRLRLAVDLNLFRNGKYLTETEDYKELGEFWESMDSGNRWGGRFGEDDGDIDDGNHFSIEHNGVK